MDREGSEALGAGVCVPASVSLGVSAPWPAPEAKKENDPPRTSPPRPHDSSGRNHAGPRSGRTRPSVAQAHPTPARRWRLLGAFHPPCSTARDPVTLTQTLGCQHRPRWLAGTRPERGQGQGAGTGGQGPGTHPGLCCPRCPVLAAAGAVWPAEGHPSLGLHAMGVSAR